MQDPRCNSVCERIIVGPIYLNIQNVVPPGQLLKINFFSRRRIALLLFPQHQRYCFT